MEGVSEYKTVYIKGNPYDTEYWKKIVQTYSWHDFAAPEINV